MKTPPLRPEPRPDALFTSVSFEPTDATGATAEGLYRALRGGDFEALTRAQRRRNRKHWSELK
jgi:hypothetical protein